MSCRLLCSATLPLLLLLGCEGAPSADIEPRRFTGPASPDEAYVLGVVTDADGGVLYVCGATDETRAQSEWLLLGPDGEITTMDGSETRGEVARTSSGLSGDVVLRGGAHLSFVLPEATSPELGVFAAVDQGCRTGVITYSGKNGASAGTWCSDDGRFEQVTPIVPVVDASLLVRVGADVTRPLRVVAIDPASIR